MIEQFGPILIGIVALIGGVWLIANSLYKTRLAKIAVNHWSISQGSVVKSSKNTANFGSPKSKNKKANTYILDFEFEYIVEGIKYNSSKPLFFGLYLYDEIEQFLTRYPVGKQVNVYYDPKNPKHAVVETVLRNSGMHQIGFGVLLIILSIILFGIRHALIYQWLN